MQVTIWQPAEPDAPYAPGAFTARLGEPIIVGWDGRRVRGVLVGATVLDGGTAAQLTFEVPDIPHSRTSRFGPLLLWMLVIGTIVASVTVIVLTLGSLLPGSVTEGYRP